MSENLPWTYVFSRALYMAAEDSGRRVFVYQLSTQTVYTDRRTAQLFRVAEHQSDVPYGEAALATVTKDSVNEYIRIYREILNGAPEAHGVVREACRDGGTQIDELHIRRVLDDNGAPTDFAVVIYHDITERTQREEQNERYRSAINTSDRYSFCYDQDTDVLTVYYFSPETRREKQLVYDHYLEKNEQGKICTEGSAETLKKLLLYGRAETKYVEIYDAVTHRPCWYALLANVISRPDGGKRTYGILWDASEHIESRRLSAKVQRALDGIRAEYVGIFEIDLQTETYTTLSYHQDEQMPIEKTGDYAAMIDSMLNSYVDASYYEVFRDFADIRHLREISQQVNRIEYEYPTTRADCAWRRTIFHVTSRDDDGKPLTLAMYQIDIDKDKSERLRQQNALSDAYKYAESANHAKTEFLSRMSHDIRTPMNAIIGMTAIARMHLNEPARMQDCLAKISASSKHLLSLINEVLDMNKIESGAMELQEESFNLADLLEETVSIVSADIQAHNHNLRVHIDGSVHENVIGDSLRLQQIFINLLSNAIKYTPNGGKIAVTVRERASNSRSYGEYEFVFEDNGIGMDEEFCKVLFEPFTRAEDSRLNKVMGTGLGMTISRTLVRMMGGDIVVSSAPGKGTRFTVTAHLRFDASDNEKLPEELQGLPVLIVDDDPLVCETGCGLFSELGMLGECCLNGNDAVEMIGARSNRGEPYFAVLLDWKMPDPDGLETARRIRAADGGDLPIIFMTGYNWSEIEQKAKEVGVSYFISKPLFRSRLVATFRHLHGGDGALLNDVIADDAAPFVDLSGCRVLLAEDNILNTEIAVELLHMCGVAVDHAANGQEAVNKFGSSSVGYYDMVLMDIQMPVMNGYDAAHAIRSLPRPDAKLPIVAMTANAFADDIVRSLAAGMNEHISKPVDFPTLQRVLNTYMKAKTPKEPEKEPALVDSSVHS